MYLGLVLEGLLVVQYLVVCETFILTSLVAIPVYTLSEQGFPFLHTPVNIRCRLFPIG